MIGDRTAERLKMEVGSAVPLDDELEATIKGRDLVTGVPRALVVTASDVREAMRDALATIVLTVKATLERTPPELSADLIDRGIVLLGGGALIRGLDALLAAECGVPVLVGANPLHAVVDGVGAVLDDLEGYRALLT
jgi:rod shape-determining protein MreB